jgi:unsaturated rhamnogalacturonyl hydrolase
MATQNVPPPIILRIVQEERTLLLRNFTGKSKKRPFLVRMKNTILVLTSAFMFALGTGDKPTVYLIGQDLTSPASVKSPGINKTVMLDNFYNNEWRKDKQGNLERFHYVWHDTTNSGYSQLGALITNAGAICDTLCQRPTAENLRRASVYVIVDPDTPKETESPNYIDSPAIETIVQWVRSGGVLVLLNNDKGNSEFEHMNQLSERFGIHFNEDSRNPVAGTAYEAGTFHKFPRHPIFVNVRKVFVKELCTLQLKKPAKTVFSDSGHVIIATSRLGKGLVFAVGDPWFYNEYMSDHRLSGDYDNPRIADNLFRWLLEAAKPIQVSRSSK